MTIGQRIRDRRRELNLTLKFVADHANISIPYLSDIERDKAQPPLKLLALIAEALKLTTVSLMEGVEELAGASEADVVLPQGLIELMEREQGKDIDDQWVQSLLRVNYRGQQPKTWKDWLMVYQTLRGIYSDIDER